jgi:hypothetical protein
MEYEISDYRVGSLEETVRKIERQQHRFDELDNGLLSNEDVPSVQFSRKPPNKSRTAGPSMRRWVSRSCSVYCASSR